MIRYADAEGLKYWEPEKPFQICRGNSKLIIFFFENCCILIKISLKFHWSMFPGIPVTISQYELR